MPEIPPVVFSLSRLETLAVDYNLVHPNPYSDSFIVIGA